jgi:hypothetical protein
VVLGVKVEGREARWEGQHRILGHLQGHRTQDLLAGILTKGRITKAADQEKIKPA